MKLLNLLGDADSSVRIVVLMLLFGNDRPDWPLIFRKSALS